MHRWDTPVFWLPILLIDVFFNKLLLFLLDSRAPLWYFILCLCVHGALFLFCFAYQILTANDMACELFGYEENQLVGRPLKDLLRLKSKEQEVITETHLEPSGQIVSLAGKVVCFLLLISSLLWSLFGISQYIVTFSLQFILFCLFDFGGTVCPEAWNTGPNLFQLTRLCSLWSKINLSKKVQTYFSSPGCDQGSILPKTKKQK